MPSTRKGSGNPNGFDDPDWYEKPGETVHLRVQRTLVFGGVQMPYKPEPTRPIPAVLFPWASLGHSDRKLPRCQVCNRMAELSALGVCPPCSRTRQRAEAADAKLGRVRGNRLRLDD